jgi:hypothetical protein
MAKHSSQRRLRIYWHYHRDEYTLNELTDSKQWIVWSITPLIRRQSYGHVFYRGISCDWWWEDCS